MQRENKNELVLKHVKLKSVRSLEMEKYSEGDEERRQWKPMSDES